MDVTLNSILIEFAEVLRVLPPFLVAVALLVFVWGLAVFIARAGDDNARTRGRLLMVWGVVALFVVVSMWGIVAILLQIFGLSDRANCTPPTLNTPTSDTLSTC